MEVKYNFDLEDWLLFQKDFLDQSKMYQRSKTLFRFLFPAFLFWILFVTSRRPPSAYAIVICSIICVIWVMYLPKYLDYSTLKRSKKMVTEKGIPTFFGPTTMILTDEGFTNINSNHEMKLKWNNIVKFIELPDHYMLYNSGVSAIVIPKKKINVDLKDLDLFLKSKLTHAGTL